MTEFASAAVEGDLDAAVIRKLAGEASLRLTAVHVRGGKEKVRSRIGSYNAAARHTPFIVMVDLDSEYACAPELIADWLPQPERQLCFRVAVRAIEAWLLGDSEHMARFLRVKRSRIPNHPENTADPKRALVDIARNSPNGDVRKDLTPRSGSGRSVGPAYSSRLIEFVNDPDGWRPEIAATACDSLARARRGLVGLSKMLT